MKKKLLALMLVAAMVMGMSMTTFAEGEKTPGSAATTFTLTKAYAVTGAVDVEATTDKNESTLFPAETLSFVSVPATDNPDTTKNLTIADVTMTGQTNTITVNVPAYNKVGLYHYTLTETAPTPVTQGVEYPAQQIFLSVFVEFDRSANATHTMKATVGLTNKGTADNKVKDGEFNNNYGVGHLAVTKTISGNLADAEKVFNVDVTFAASKAVKSDVTYVDSGVATTIPASQLNGKTVTVTVKANETVNFYNIPAGVTYTVKEQDYTGGTKNQENAYDAPTYAVNEGKATTAENGVTEASAAGQTDTVVINNNKEAVIDTGLIINNFPYILALAAVALVAVAFMRKRRSF